MAAKVSQARHVAEGRWFVEGTFRRRSASRFRGIEPNTGTFDPDEAIAAAEETGLIIDGTVCGDHWKVRHTDPDPEVRREALQSLTRGIRQTAAVGADTILLVPGHGKDGDDATVYRRSLENIRKALPVAQQHGVSILMENVWNDFLYDHEGGDDQTAERLAEFVDAFASPLVGVQFDIGNHGNTVTRLAGFERWETGSRSWTSKDSRA